ncbi:unnamed protein product [Caenorhabditis auriculariae]|uniref:G-protein coupled receptors family 1 profile domain-containing protein n=1 Tax=Caenorhabditis auriculariae TaxID=2777116 RepID=A0A8S1HEE6_9PELO|nr:unnamed protein product [Caenorhabditis auriculariae]
MTSVIEPTVDVIRGDVAESPTLLALFALHVAICLVALFFNFLLLFLLYKYTVFHYHMTVICINLTTAVIICLGYLLLRSLLGLYQINHRTPTSETDQKDAFCVFDELVPQALCVLFFVFPLLLVTERTYATRRFWVYEYENFRPVVMLVCLAVWLPTLGQNARTLVGWTTPTSLAACQVLLLRKTFLQRNFWFIVVSAFSLLYMILFKILEKQNKRNEEDYVANHYSTISIRFQIRENVKTCRFFVSLNFLFLLTFLLFFVFDQDMDDDKYSPSVLTRKESTFLVFPMFGLLYALHFIFSHTQLFEKAKRTLRQLAASHGEQEKMFEP